MLKKLFILMILACGLITGCGRMGPLTLPDQTPNTAASNNNQPSDAS